MSDTHHDERLSEENLNRYIANPTPALDRARRPAPPEPQRGANVETVMISYRRGTPAGTYWAHFGGRRFVARTAEEVEAAVKRRHPHTVLLFKRGVSNG